MDTVHPVKTQPVVHGTVCPTCNRILKGRSWDECAGEVSDAACQVALLSLIKHEDIRFPEIELSVDNYSGNVFRISGHARSNYKGVFLENDLSTEVRLSLAQCPFCSKRSGNYFEAILQIRGLEGLSEDEIEKLLNHINDSTEKIHLKDPNVFISRFEKVRGGYDFYMGENSFTKQMAQKLHDTYGGEAKWSSSLFGRKGGRDIYRHTYLVRLPGFVVGDYLIREEDTLKVIKIARRIMVRSLKTSRDEALDHAVAMEMRKMKKNEIEVDLVIISHDDTEIQVLHPTTFVTTVLLLEGRKPEGETIKGALIEGDLYLV